MSSPTPSNERLARLESEQLSGKSAHDIETEGLKPVGVGKEVSKARTWAQTESDKLWAKALRGMKRYA